MRIKVKKFLGILLSIVLVWGLMPAMDLEVKAATSLPSAVNGVITLTENVELSSTLVVQSNLTVDLNGYGIIYKGDSLNNNGYIFRVKGNGTLTMRDSRPTTQNYITMENYRGIAASTSTPSVDVFSSGNGYVEIQGGFITGATRVCVSVATGSFTMNGGNIVGNSDGGVAITNDSDFGYTNGTFEMNGGSIIYNNGTGVHTNDATFKISGNPVVRDNAGCNVKMYYGKMTVTSALEPGCNIHLTADPHVITTGYSGNNNQADPSNFFTCDLDGYSIVKNNDEVEVVRFYPLWIGGTQVTSAKKSDTGWSYNNTTNTLTLSGASITTTKTVNQYVNAAVYYEGTEDLRINLDEGTTTTITNTDTTGDINPCGIYSNANLIISGNGNLNITTGANGIYIPVQGKNITIENGVINALGTTSGITASVTGIITINDGNVTARATGTGGTKSGISAGKVSILGGEVTASGQTYGITSSGNNEGLGIIINGGKVAASGVYAIGANSEIAINGGTVIANGDSYGISAYNKSISIDNGITFVTAIGNQEQAIRGVLSTSLLPKAYLDSAGTEPTSYDSSNLATYKRLEFAGYKALDTTGDTTPVTISIPTGHTAPVVGDVLTVSCDATDLIYEWFIDGISQGTASADNTSYTVTSADFGKTIKVKVYQTKNSEGSDYAVDERPSKESATTAEVIKTDAQIVAEVENMIAALPLSPNVTLDDKAAIEAAYVAYEALTDSQKSLVNSDLVSKLNGDLIALAMREVSPKTGSEATYSGQTIQLVNAPTTSLPTGYSMYYSIGDNIEAPSYDITSADENKKWKPFVPTENDAGTYYVWYTVVDGDSHVVCSAECVSVTIAKASSQSAIVNPLDRIYDGTEQPLVTVNQAKLQNKLMTLRRMLTPSTFEEFVDEEQEDKQDTEKDAQKSDATDESQSEEVKDTQNNSDDEELTEETKTSTTDEQNQNDNDEKGEQKDSELHEEKIIKNSMLIKDILTPTVDDTENAQQEEENDDKELSEKADKVVESEETADETKEKSVDEKSDDETEASSDETKESKQESETTKEETQEESTATTEENDEKPVVSKAMRTVRLLRTTPTEDPGLKFALGSNSQVEPIDGWSADIPKARNAGTYYVWYKVEGDANHNGTEAACTTVIISRATVTVTAKNQTITVGDTVPTLDSSDLYTVSGLFGEDELIKAPSLNYQKNGESVEPDNTKAASYDIVPSGASAGENYNITYVKGTLKISESASAVAEIVPSEEPTSIIAKDPEISNGLAEQAEKMAENGDKVELKLVVAPKGESNVTESEVLTQVPQVKRQLESQFKEENTVKIDVVDIDIKQIINGATQENLKETNAVLEIAIGYDFTGKYDPVVIRDHEGNAKAFRALDARPSGNYEDGTFFADVENNVIYLYSRYFSTYVIAYSTVEGNATNREPVVTTTSGGEISQPEVSTIPVYRLFNLKKGYHFFTANAAEKDALVAAGWTDEGVAWQVQPNAGAPVYRLFDKAKGMHIFTVDVAERDACIAAGASDEGIAWHAPTNIGRTVYKITNPNVNKVLYTISTAEKDALAATGFTVEEAKFKAY